MTLTAPQPATATAEARVAPARNGAEAILQLFAARGVDYIFLNPGTDTAPLQEAYVALRAEGRAVPKIVPCLYENVALAAAHAYFQVTRRPQVVWSTWTWAPRTWAATCTTASAGRAGW